MTTITNFSTAIFLVNPAAKAVLCSYEQDAVTGKGKAPFTMFKSLDPDLAIGEFVVVPTDTRHGKTVVRVEEIGDAASVDLESQVQVRWIIDAVRMDAYEAILEQEKAGIEAIKSAELRRRREELHAKLIADNPELASLSKIDPVATPALAAPEFEEVPEYVAKAPEPFDKDVF